MDGIANVARQQQSQFGVQEMQSKVQEQLQQTQHLEHSKPQKEDLIKQSQDGSINTNKKTESEKDMDDLIKQLNSEMSQLNPNIKFGVDKDDIFYVAAIDAKTNKVIRRFPAEKARDFLPKMREVTGMLFEHKG